MINLENIEKIDRFAQEYISEHRDPNKPYTGHDIPHLRTVARLTELAALAAGFCPRDTELSRITGWFHDFERSMNETNSLSDEQLSVAGMYDFLGGLYHSIPYYTSHDEREAMGHAILVNSRPPAFFADRPDPKQWTLPERLNSALFVADKMEANGIWVIARRSQFVGGARLQAPDADLPKYGLQSGRDENKAVLLEGALRIAFINPEHLYPPVFRPLTSVMYGPQRDFMHGLLASEGMNIESYGRMIMETQHQDSPHPNYLQARDIQAPQGLNFALMVSGGLSDIGIQEAKGDLAYSSAEAVEYFSSDPNSPLEQMVHAWEPKHVASNKWREDMIYYVNGDWFTAMREQLSRR